MRISNDQLKKIHKIELSALVKFDEVCRKYNIRYSLAAGTMLGAIRHHGFIPWDDDIDVIMLREDLKRLRKVDVSEWGSEYFYQSHQTDSRYLYTFDKLRVNGTYFGEKALEGTGIKHTGVYIDIFSVEKVPENFKQNIQVFQFNMIRLLFMAKYINIDFRKGMEKKIAKILRMFLKNVSDEKLFEKYVKIITKYNNTNSEKYRAFTSFNARKEVYKEKYFDELIDVEFEGKSFKVTKYYDEILTKLYGNYMNLPPKNQQINKHEVTGLIV